MTAPSATVPPEPAPPRDLTPRLMLGDYRDTLDGETWDALVVDGPYGKGTHKGYTEMEAQMRSATGQATLTAIAYQHWTPRDVRNLIAFAAPRTRGWMAAFTSHDLILAYHSAYRKAGLYPFAPVSVIQKRPRLIGDGPASWTVYLMVARPRTREFATWGCLPGSYESTTEKLGIVAGAKPLDLMRAIVRDYSRPGDTVCDPCAGGATTLLAAAMEGRRGIGSEMDPDTHAKAAQRLATHRTRAAANPSLFATQPPLFEEP